MKNIRNLFVLLFLAFQIASIKACPVCVGEITGKSAPFFEEESYQGLSKSKGSYRTGDPKIPNNDDEPTLDIDNDNDIEYEEEGE